MHSRTKAKISEEKILQMIEVAGIKDSIKIKELTGGEFNVAYMIYAKDAKYILKIGPSEGTITLTHEKGIMNVELWAYEQIRKYTNIKIPQIIHSGHEVIGNHWFIMSELEGKLLCDAELNEEQMYQWQY